MPNILNYLRRPEYVFRPQQVWRRFRRLGTSPQAIENVTLPWGAAVNVRPNENVGSGIYYYGIFDRIVPEIYRRAIRDILFENLQPILSPAGEFLQQRGFTLFQLLASWWTPVLAQVHAATKPATGFSCLATLDPQRARERFHTGGWHGLACRRYPS